MITHETREDYIKRMAERYLDVAKVHFALGYDRSVWEHLFSYAMAEDVYGEHWDKLKEKENA
jgi:hypothetical protein